MIGNFKILGIIIILLLCSCKKQNGMVENGRELIKQNINVLIDSIDIFDTSKMPISKVSKKDFKNYKPIKIEQIRVGLLDSILVKDVDLKTDVQTNYLKFNLQTKDLINLKSKYKIIIVKVNNYDTNFLFVNFFNFKIQGNKASIEVKKNIGISMLHHKYYFEKGNGVWVFKKKELLGMG
jgi:hypothetical protein